MMRIKMRGKALYFFLFVVFHSLLTLPVSVRAEEISSLYSVAVVPQLPGVVTHRNWAPMLKYLEQQTGLEFELKIYKDIPTFEKALIRGEPDFAYMNPYHAVLAKDKQGYLPLVRDSSRQLMGILVVHKDSPIKTIKDLHGSELGFPAPNAFGASLYLRSILIEREGIRFTPRYLKTHGNVYRNVILQTVSAGGGVKKTLSIEPDSVKEQLRILYQTPGVAPHPVSVHPRVIDSVRKKFVEAILTANDSEQGKARLKKIHLPKPVIAEYEKDYQMPLQNLHLERYIESAIN